MELHWQHEYLSKYNWQFFPTAKTPDINNIEGRKRKQEQICDVDMHNYLQRRER